MSAGTGRAWGRGTRCRDLSFSRRMPGACWAQTTGKSAGGPVRRQLRTLGRRAGRWGLRKPQLGSFHLSLPGPALLHAISPAWSDFLPAKRLPVFQVSVPTSPAPRSPLGGVTAPTAHWSRLSCSPHHTDLGLFVYVSRPLNQEPLNFSSGCEH